MMDTDRITGTAGIDFQRTSVVSLDNSLRFVDLPSRGSARKKAFDTPVSHEVFNCPVVDEALAKQLFDRWAARVEAGVAPKITALYTEDAVLTPMVSTLPRIGRREIEGYYGYFLTLEPKIRHRMRTVRKGCHKLTDAGVCVLSLTDRQGTREVQARYTFVYSHVGGEWKILHHHFSIAP
jgi:uncharacterized protein (TIGR02246 family)